mgnify:CR=1 FL=1
MNVRKRGLALLMCICMIFTLLPFSALADATTQDVVYGTYGDDGKWYEDKTLTAESSVKHYPAPGEASDSKANIDYSKTAVKNDDGSYNVTLTIKSKTSETAPGASAVVLVIDSSASMKNGRLDSAKSVAKEFIDKYGSSGSDRYLAVVNFDTYANAFEFGSRYNKTNWLDVSNADNRKNVKSSFENLYPGGGTNLEQGLVTANALLGKLNNVSNDNKFVIVLTDGEPTFYSNTKNWNLFQYVPEGNGSSCDEATYNATLTAASSIKSNAKYIYTVCYGAESETVDYSKETVGDFLANHIASTDKAYNAKDDDNSLSDAFAKIYESIKHGISSGFTVTDPMGQYVELQDTSLTDSTISKGTITWTPKNGTTVENSDGSKTTTYTLTYKVTLGEVPKDDTYPLNKNTTLKFKDGKNADGSDNNVTLQFNVPGVKGKAPTYTVTYKPGDHGTLAGADAAGNVVTSGLKKGDNTPAAPIVTPAYGYEFAGWNPERADKVAGDATYVAQYRELNNLSYTIEHYWIGDKTQTIRDNIVKNDAKLGDTKTVAPEAAAKIDGYTIMPEQSENSTEITATSDKVIKLYYYKNVTVEAKDYEKAARTDDPTFEATVTGVVGTDNINYTITRPDGETAGTYTLTPSGEDIQGNYKVVEWKTGTLTIYDTYTVTYKYECTDGSDAAESLTPPATMSYRAGTTITVADEPEATALEGYKFIGWYKDGTKIDAGATFNITADTEIIGKWEPITGLSYVVHYYWVGTEDKVAPDKTVDGQTFGTVITSETPIEVANYKAVPGQVSNLTISTENENNVITFYYYKNVELTSNSGEAKYDGTLKTVDGFKAIVAADNGADIYEQLKEVLAAHGEGTDAGSYTVYFKRGVETIPVESFVDRVLNDRYWVTKAEQGKLTISPRSLTITSGSDSKYYDGTPLTNDTIKVSGDGFVTGEGAKYNVTGSQTEIGSSKNTFDVIFNNNTKADNYAVEKKLGDLTVNRRPMPPVNPPIMDEITVEITGNSDSVVYDGTEHSVKGYTVKISDPRYTEKDFTFTGKAEASGVNAGTYEMGLKAEQFKNTNARFTNVKFVIKADGVLTITPKDLTITAGSKTEYGPTPVTCDEWTVSGLVAGDKVESVKITGIQSVPGSSPNVPSDAVIKNAKGEDVTKNYAIKYVNGTLTMLEVLNKEDHFNYIIGTPEGLSLPTANVTRAEVATIFFRLMTDDARAKFDSLDNSFSDVAKGKWYNRAISTLAKAGIIKGDPAGTYRPGDPITRAEMAAIIARFGDFKEGGKTFSDISGHWAQKYIELAASNGWINGNPDGTFKPNNNITRAETVAMINRVLNRQTESNDDLLPVSQMTNWSDNMDTAKWYYRDMQEATNNHKAERVGTSMYEKWTEKLPDIDWASYQI